MANAIVPRLQGDEYQARVFWTEATRLFQDNPIVTAVGFEVDGIRVFDDVAVFYGGMHRDGTDPDVRADYFQVKFHVAQDGAFTAAALTDPAFIGAEMVSLLQRLRDAQRRHAPTGREARFIILAPWPIAHDDVLGELYSNANESLRLDRLAAGGPKSKMGRTRAMWRSHLGLSTDEELFLVLRTLRIRTSHPPLDGLLRYLNPLLINAGMKPYPDGKVANLYDGLPGKLMQTGQRQFTRDQLAEVIAREGLHQPRPATAREAGRQIGIRSFRRWAENMDDETERILCLLPHFDGRNIRDASLWNKQLAPAVRDYLQDAINGAEAVDLHLDTHLSVAFTAGWCLDPKTGVVANPVQRGVNGRTTWCLADGPPCHDEHVWTQRVIELTGAPDVAVVLSVSRAAIAEAELFIREHLPAVGQIIELNPCSGTGSGSIRDAAHARRLADDAAEIVAAAQQQRPRNAVVHVFGAAPNGLMFFLGQVARVWGRCIMYEHDFDRTQPTAYTPSVSLPFPLTTISGGVPSRGSKISV